MNHQKGFANIVLIVVVIALIGMASYFVLVQKSEPVVEQVPPTQALTPSPAQISDNKQTPAPTPSGETANWKIYRNGQYGFELSYPSDIKLSASETKITTKGDTRLELALERPNQKLSFFAGYGPGILYVGDSDITYPPKKITIGERKVRVYLKHGGFPNQVYLSTEDTSPNPTDQVRYDYFIAILEKDKVDIDMIVAEFEKIILTLRYIK